MMASDKNETVRLLERWKRSQGIEGDSEAARALGIARQTVSNWRTRNSHADAALIVLMCHELGEDLGACLLRIAHEQFKSGHRGRVLETRLRGLRSRSLEAR